MRMNEDEIAMAAERYAEHPVLGPATATLASLVAWTNANSGGWCYWPAPGRAAARLQELIRGDGLGYAADRPDVTREAYKAALVPLKAFRTRYEREHSAGLRPAFEICEPLAPGESGKVWHAIRVYEAAQEAEAVAQAGYQTLARLREAARRELDRLRDAQRLEELNRQVKDGTVTAGDLARLGRFRAGSRRGPGPPGSAGQTPPGCGWPPS
jgi:hypothetical protein